MILHQFPDLQWLKEQADKSFKNRKGWDGKMLLQEGWPTVILNTQTKNTFRDNIRGPLSLFINLSGDSHVSVGNKRVKVKEDFFFVTNQDQHYTLEIDQETPTQTFNIHFGEYFADKVYASLTKPVNKLLDDHFQKPQQRFDFYNKLHQHDNYTKQLLHHLKNYGHTDSLFLEEGLYNLLIHLFEVDEGIKHTIKQLPVIKSSTRNELFQRLLLATDYIFSFYDKPLSLEDLSQISCLSKFHFLRLFKIAFGKTPHQFITEVRIQRAKELLKATKLEVNEIALQTGFGNSSSFSRMFYQRTQAYPSQYRST